MLVTADRISFMRERLPYRQVPRHGRPPFRTRPAGGCLLAAGLRPSPATRHPCCPLLRGIKLLPRILDLGDRIELDVGEMSVHLLGAANVDVLVQAGGPGCDP